MEFHEAANLFPMMNADDFSRLVDDISRGYDSRFPILTFEGKILDGRNRYAACLKAEVEPVYEEWVGDNPVEFVVRANVNRRHFTSSQLAVLALEVEKQLAEEARKRQATSTGGSNPQLTQLFAEADKGEAREQAARMVGTNRQYVSDAKNIAEKAPELLDKVRSGEMSIPEAKREIHRREFPDEEGFAINRCDVCGHLYSNELLSCPYCDKFKGMEVIEVERKPHVSNNSGNNEWYTPAEYIDAARYVMGSIDLDPASSDVANQTVKAVTYYTIDNDGLQHEWFGRVWMNPPYASGFVDKFTEKLTMHYQDGDIEEAIVLVNNATETTWFQQMSSVCKCICFPRRRVKFIDIDGNPSGAPLQGQAILYMGSNMDEFANVFSKFGIVLYA
jgi:rubrerythrin